LLALLAPLGAEAGGAAPSKGTARPRIAVVAVGPKAEALADRVAATGKGRPDVELSRFSVRPLAPEPEPPIRAIKEALAASTRDFESFDLDGAKKHLGEATALIAPYTRTSAVLALERESLMLQISLAHAARDELDLALSAYAERFPGPPSKAPWPPAVSAKLAKKLPPRDASLSIKSDAPGATVELDGEVIGAVPVAITQLVAGPHRLRATAPGRLPTDETVTLEAGAGASVTLVLPLDLATALGEAHARDPLDEEVARALLAAAEIDRVILVEATGKGATLAMLDAAANGQAVVTSPRAKAADLALALDTLLGPRPEDIPPPVVASGPGLPTWAWVAIGSGAASVVGGIGLRLSAVSVENTLIAKEGALTQTEAFDLQSTAESRATIGTVLIVLGLAAVTAVGGWVWSESP